jgi:pimeloyl-ACP methyl ester carboxylesterase
MAHLKARDINLHYLQVGNGPDVLMLHGLTGNQAVWHLKMIPLLRHAFRMTTFDLRGHGRSDMTPSGYSTDNMAEDLLALMDALEIPHADIVGHSLGADIALHFALHHPDRVRSLVLIEAGIPALAGHRKDADWEGWAYWAKMLEEFAGVQVPRDRWNDIAYMVKQSMQVPIIYGPARGLPRKQNSIVRLIEETTIVQDYDIIGDLTLENLATIPHRKMLVYDQSSPYMDSFRTLSDILRNCAPVLLPATKYRHFGPLEAPDLLVEHVLRFLGPQAVSGVTISPEVSWSAT